MYDENTHFQMRVLFFSVVRPIIPFLKFLSERMWLNQQYIDTKYDTKYNKRRKIFNVQMGETINENQVSG